MEFKELQQKVDDMYMVINDQAVNDDFVTVLKWQDLEEFVREVYMIRELSVFKIEVKDRDNYNHYLISYLRNLTRRSAKHHFPFKVKMEIEEDDFSDDRLVDAMINIHADGNKVENGEIIMTEDFTMTEYVKYLVDEYGFNLKINKND